MGSQTAQKLVQSELLRRTAQRRPSTCATHWVSQRDHSTAAIDLRDTLDVLDLPARDPHDPLISAAQNKLRD